MRRETDWPKYMRPRRLASGVTSYYWIAPAIYTSAGYSIKSVPLGNVFSAARNKAGELNEDLRRWRRGGLDREVDVDRLGTVDWWIDEYMKTKSYRRLGERQQKDYRRLLHQLADLKSEKTIDPRTGEGQRLGGLMAESITPEAADKFYGMLSKSGRVVRQAHYAVSVAQKAWNVVSRLHPGYFLVTIKTPRGSERQDVNPWKKVEVEKGHDSAIPATRSEAFALADALTAIGHPHLGVAALIAFEWHVRPQNILSGGTTWKDIAWENGRAISANVRHLKTLAEVEMPLYDPEEDREFYPELIERLKKLERLGEAIVMFRPVRGSDRTPRTYSYPYAGHMVRKARKLFNLPDHLTLEACRHGGITEVGDSGSTGSEERSLTGHRTERVLERYNKRTMAKRINGLNKRRDLIEKPLKPRRDAI